MWVSSLRLKEEISRSLTIWWAMIPTEGLSGPYSGLVANLERTQNPSQAMAPIVSWWDEL